MSQVKCLYTLMAKEITTDSNDQMNSIIKIIDRFNVEIQKNDVSKDINPDKPIAAPIPYAVGTSWIFEEKSAKEIPLIAKIVIVDPAKKKHQIGTHDYSLPVGHNKMNINFNIQGLPILKEGGEYICLAELRSKNNELLASGKYPFTVDVKEISKE